MNIRKNSFARSLVVSVAFAALLSLGGNAFAQDAMSGMGQGAKVDKRKLTTIQTVSVDDGQRKNAVEVRYLNLPWGKATFGYIETGIDPRNGNYYAKRSWPVAHLHLAAPARYEGKLLAPGDYAMIIMPKNPETKTGMKLAFASFKPAGASGTFLVPGNVFVETPKDAVVVAEKEITFAGGAPLAEQLMIHANKEGKTISINIHYGDRTLTEKLTLQ